MGGRLPAADLEIDGEAAWCSGKLDEAITLREQACAAYAAGSDERGAARMAITRAWDLEGRGSLAISGGWLATAERLLGDVPESSEQGTPVPHARDHGALRRGRSREGRCSVPRASSRSASATGRRRCSRSRARGERRSERGDTDRGLALLDEASASAVSGELGPHTTGLVYCVTIGACQDLGELRRAAEWTEAASRMCDRIDVSGLSGKRRVHRARSGCAGSGRVRRREPPQPARSSATDDGGQGVHVAARVGALAGAGS